MNFFQRLRSQFQWLTPLLVSAALFCFSSGPLRWLDPTAGTFDAGVLQVPILAAVWWFFAVAVAWAGLRASFPTLDDWIDAGHWKEAWQLAASHDDRRFALLYVAGVLAALFTSYLIILITIALLL